ncbi:hypothetical protein GTC6_14829 [Gordonia terrae C-6]|uniref:Uncharacterized protein n=1 Tax=Gordonia terrae C-6 TaxID=1316928 RepID=R7Y860_9ACTN|nr:hypothetical protein GTC6_14829 [Gordonia terrae C-6]
MDVIGGPFDRNPVGDSLVGTASADHGCNRADRNTDVPGGTAAHWRGTFVDTSDETPVTWCVNVWYANNAR